MAAGGGDDSNRTGQLLIEPPQYTRRWKRMTMHKTFLTSLAIAVLVTASGQAGGHDWMNFVVRTSGLGWSDGYHAYDQCPPKHQGHGPHRLPAKFPTWSSGQEQQAPYYFEEPGYKAGAVKEANELLPTADAKGGDPRTPSPQARYQPRNRYFEALQAEQQSPLQQARR